MNLERAEELARKRSARITQVVTESRVERSNILRIRALLRHALKAQAQVVEAAFKAQRLLQNVLAETLEKPKGVQ